MNGSWETLATALLRTTLVTSVAAVAAMGLLWLLRIRSAKTHRIVWLLVIAQGWLLWPYTWRMHVERPRELPVVTAPVELALSPVVITPTTSPEETAPPASLDWVAASVAASIAAWCLGIGLLVALGAWRYARLFSSGRPGEEVTQAEWLAEWNEVRRLHPSNHRAELRTTHNTGPLVCWVPWVLLVLVPRTLWASLARGERLAILRHELAHCQRGDLWKNLAVRLLALPQWFNPLVWLAVRRFEEAGEWACDERVARQSGDSATEYARVLLHVADYSTAVPSGAAGLSGGVLSRRVKRLLHLPNKEVREMRGFILPVLLVVVGLFQAVRIEQVKAVEPAPDVPPTAAAETTEKIPDEWSKRTLPPYVIEPPDILLVDAMKLVPKSPHQVEEFDGLLVRATDVDDEGPIHNVFFVDPEGNIDLGTNYGKIHVAGIPLDKADEVVRMHFEQRYPKAKTSVSLATAGGVQQVVGEHLVGPDGRVNLGKYGSVYVTGMTLAQAKEAIEKHLAEHMVDPEVIVDVFSYNSKKYYIITKSGGHGDNVVTAPITGNDTVLDAIAAIGGLKDSSAAKIWIARPAPPGKNVETTLPVDYNAITGGKHSTTNYQLLPGDRLFIEYGDQRELAPPEQVKKGAKPADRYSDPDNDAYGREPTQAQADGGGTSNYNAYIVVSRTPSGDVSEVAPISPNDLLHNPHPRELVGVGINSDAGVVGKIKIDEQKSAPPEVLQATHLRAQPTVEGDERVTKAKIRLVTDPKQNLRNVEGLEKGFSITGETRLLAGLLGVLAKNGLTRELASPTITALNGKVARIHVDDDETDSPRVVDVELLNRHSGNQVVFEARASVQLGKRKRTLDTAFALTEGQSYLVRIPKDEKVPKSEDLYLLVSRESVE
ncbi:polysaccharide biosynthesis/export family protein [Aeoliella sp. ICT_H6.2]|uniref:Polysaccharide biosynthesis/export family protein n=1 Tax=Aeoliella straminimaris TaxID=2954799 RepID=A0A9X2JI12_9BACT|nr:M56 family metallopeptidase [Aeoliella straminimaris]MCO6046047.1 polysaccharide biosynthesis/export family protein [Aeoliella straminimaris]